MSTNSYKHELNQKFYSKHGHGFGCIGLDKTQAAALQSLTVEQLDALLKLIILGDIEEIGWHKDLLGPWHKANFDINDREAAVRTSLAATLVYLSGRLAEEIPILEIDD